MGQYLGMLELKRRGLKSLPKENSLLRHLLYVRSGGGRGEACARWVVHASSNLHAGGGFLAQPHGHGLSLPPREEAAGRRERLPDSPSLRATATDGRRSSRCHYEGENGKKKPQSLFAMGCHFLPCYAFPQDRLKS